MTQNGDLLIATWLFGVIICFVQAVGSAVLTPIGLLRAAFEWLAAFAVLTVTLLVLLMWFIPWARRARLRLTEWIAEETTA